MSVLLKVFVLHILELLLNVSHLLEQMEIVGQLIQLYHLQQFVK